MLELNSWLNRLDFAVPYVRESVNAVVKTTIDTGTHDETALSFMKFRVAQARRAWVEKENIINCLPWEELEKYLKSEKWPRGSSLMITSLGSPIECTC